MVYCLNKLKYLQKPHTTNYILLFCNAEYQFIRVKPTFDKVIRQRKKTTTVYHTTKK